MICSVSSWGGGVTYKNASCQWLDYVWCDVRLHYAKRSADHVTSSQFLRQVSAE